MIVDLALVCLAAAVTVAVRAAFIAVSAAGAVDHYYWILAARAYRGRGRLPVRIPGKYLLEDERQTYPPLFGWLLARFPERWLANPKIVWLMQAADAAVLAIIGGFVLGHGASLREIAVLVAVFGTAPVLVAYNTQLASRAVGNVFLVIAMLAAASASGRPGFVADALILSVATVVAAAAVVLTHKMTLQLMLALWLPWVAVLSDWRVLLVVPLAIIIATLLTGYEFARLQWLAHVDIVSFWHRHRDELGAHLFNHSPIYGDHARRHETTFHQPGPRGWMAHAVLAFSYGPLVWLAPLTLLWALRPPAWIILWSTGTAVVALLTLYVPPLRRFGGGHLYIFNAIAPTAMWWAFLMRVPDAATLTVFAVGLAATLVSLALGLRRRRSAASTRDGDFSAVIARLTSFPPGRIAVFPLTASEEVAFRTHHKVLWGGHGLSFRQLEPLYPVVRSPIATLVRTNACNLLLLDSRYWPDGERVIGMELPQAQISAFGAWRLVTLSLEPTRDLRAADAVPA